MLALLLLSLFLGLIWGFLLFTLLFLHLLKVKCPKCKQLRPVRQIILFSWKQRIISGQACPRCQTIKTQVNIF